MKNKSMWDSGGNDKSFEHYRKSASDTSKVLRDWVDKAYYENGLMQYLDNDFVSKLKNNDFFARLWELELAEWLQLLKFKLSHTKGTGPDFYIELSDGRKVWVEAVLSRANEEMERIWRENINWYNTKNGKKYNGKNVLITAGARRKKLNVKGAKEFDNKGLTYCASCDGPLFSNMDVAVIGGGNAGFETAAQLLAYAKSVTLLCRKQICKADIVTVKKVAAHPNMKIITEAEITEVKGDKFVTGISYKDLKTNKIYELPLNGVFIEIGNIPSTDFVKNIVKLDEYGRIITNHKNQQTSTPGIWAAGDVTDELYHQNNIAAGDAIKAIEDIYQHHTTK